MIGTTSSPEQRTATDQPGRSPRSTKVRAVLAGGLVLGVGGAVTLAAWTDTEWVWAGGGAAGGEDPIGTDSFELEQRVATDPAGTFFDRETDADGGRMEFGLGAISLTPGDIAYGWVQLRTKTPSLGADVALAGAVPHTPSTQTALFDALTYQAVLVPDDTSCTAAGVAAAVVAGDVLVPAGSTLVTGAGATTFPLLADSGSVETVCFAVTLPDTPANQADPALRGATAAPAWAFTGTSTS